MESSGLRGVHLRLPSTRCSCGDTGVGKSDLMRLYSAMVNADCALVPDMLSYVKVGLKRVIKVIKARGAVPEGVLDAFYVPAAPGRGNSDHDRAWLLDTSVPGGGDETTRLLGLLRNNVEWAATPGLINEVRGVLGTVRTPLRRSAVSLLQVGVALAADILPVFGEFPLVEVPHIVHGILGRVVAYLSPIVRDVHVSAVSPYIGAATLDSDATAVALARQRSVWLAELAHMTRGELESGPTPRAGSNGVGGVTSATSSTPGIRHPVFRSASDLAQFVDAFVRARPRGLYFKWLV